MAWPSSARPLYKLTTETKPGNIIVKRPKRREIFHQLTFALKGTGSAAGKFMSKVTSRPHD